jgi:hypothetical protein
VGSRHPRHLDEVIEVAVSCVQGETVLKHEGRETAWSPNV